MKVLDLPINSNWINEANFISPHSLQSSETLKFSNGDFLIPLFLFVSLSLSSLGFLLPSLSCELKPPWRLYNGILIWNSTYALLFNDVAPFFSFLQWQNKQYLYLTVYSTFTYITLKTIFINYKNSIMFIYTHNWCLRNTIFKTYHTFFFLFINMYRYER